MPWFAVRSRPVYCIEIAYNRTDAKTLRAYICEGVSRWKKKTTRIKVQDYEEKTTKRKVQDINKNKEASIKWRQLRIYFYLLNFYFCFFLFFYFICLFSFQFLFVFCLFKIVFVIVVCLSPFIRAYFFFTTIFLNDFLWLFRQCVVLWVGVCRKWFCLF